MPVPLTMIDTSGSGVPASLVILPVIVLCCADACAATRNTGNSIMSTRLIMSAPEGGWDFFCRLGGDSKELRPPALLGGERIVLNGYVNRQIIFPPASSRTDQAPERRAPIDYCVRDQSLIDSAWRKIFFGSYLAFIRCRRG